MGRGFQSTDVLYGALATRKQATIFTLRRPSKEIDSGDLANQLQWLQSTDSVHAGRLYDWLEQAQEQLSSGRFRIEVEPVEVKRARSWLIRQETQMVSTESSSRSQQEAVFGLVNLLDHWIDVIDGFTN